MMIVMYTVHSNEEQAAAHDKDTYREKIDRMRLLRPRFRTPKPRSSGCRRPLAGFVPPYMIGIPRLVAGCKRPVCGSDRLPGGPERVNLRINVIHVALTLHLSETLLHTLRDSRHSGRPLAQC